MPKFFIKIINAYVSLIMGFYKVTYGHILQNYNQLIGYKKLS